MDKAEFDQCADEYHLQHKANIAITGEAPEYFAEYKVAELQRVALRENVIAKNIIDFGSGIGNSIPYFRSHFPDASLGCADVSARSLELAHVRFPGPERPILIDGSAIAARDDSFDIAFSACVFHHITHEEHVIWMQELRRVTRTGGLISIFEHNPLNPITVHAVNTCPFDKNARLIRAGVLAGRLREAGWQQTAINYHLFFPRAAAAFRVLEPSLRWLPIGAQYSVTARKL